MVACSRLHLVILPAARGSRGEKPNSVAMSKRAVSSPSPPAPEVCALSFREGTLDDKGRCNLYQRCLDDIAEGIMVVDQDRQYLLFNPAAERTLGKGLHQGPIAERAAFYGLHRADGCTPLTLDEIPTERALRGESFDDYEAFVRNPSRPDGVFITCTGRPMRDDGGRVLGAIVSFRDITAQRRTERVLDKFHTAAEQSASTIVIVDDAGVIEYVNPCAVRTFKREPEAVLGRRIFDLTEHGSDELHRLWEIIHRDGEFRGNTVAYRDDGTPVFLTGTITSICNAQGKIVNWLAILLDTGEQQRIEREKRESETRFRRLVETSLMGVLVGRDDGRLVETNDELLRIVGLRRDKLQRNKTWRESTSGLPRWRDLLPDDKAEAEAVELDLNERGEATPFEKEYMRADGTALPLFVGMARVTDTDQIIAVAIDLSKQKQAEAELKQAADDLARSNADLQQFAHIVSHDLQEPLRMVSGFLGMLKKRHTAHLDEDAARLVDHAIEGASGMQTLIRDLLEYSRVDFANRGIEPCEADAAFQTALANLATSIEESEADVRATHLPRVRIDLVQLVQVFQNLVGNAVKFHRPGERPRVRVSAKRVGGDWVFSVSDNGIGIETRQHERIFTIFQRLHPRSQYPGTGIGLAITKKIVERHGGRIWVESTRGGGSTFHFTVPAETSTK